MIAGRCEEPCVRMLPSNILIQEDLRTGVFHQFHFCKKLIPIKITQIVKLLELETMFILIFALSFG